MAKKATDEPHDADVKVDAHPPVTHDPLKTVGLETTVHGVYVYLEDPAEVDAAGAFDQYTDDEGKVQIVHVRRIVVGGKSYEHTTEDADGCWIYRQM